MKDIFEVDISFDNASAKLRLWHRTLIDPMPERTEEGMQLATQIRTTFFYASAAWDRLTAESRVMFITRLASQNENVLVEINQACFKAGE